MVAVPVAPLVSLVTFISNTMYGILLIDDDQLSDQTLNKTISRDFMGKKDGQPLDFETFRTFVHEFRRDVTDRQLVSQTYLTVSESQNAAGGTLGRNLSFTGIRHGKRVQGNAIHIIDIAWNAELGQRQVVGEEGVIQLKEIDS